MRLCKSYAFDGPGRRHGRISRLHRTLVQSAGTACLAGQHESHHVRAGGSSLPPCPL